MRPQARIQRTRARTGCLILIETVWNRPERVGSWVLGLSGPVCPNPIVAQRRQDSEKLRLPERSDTGDGSEATLVMGAKRLVTGCPPKERRNVARSLYESERSDHTASCVSNKH